MKPCRVPLDQAPRGARLNRTLETVLYACALQFLSILAGFVLAQLFR